MEANQARPQNMIDTTDALEAVSACQSMKNILFMLIMIGLVVCQVIFWMNHFGLVNKDGCAACPGEEPISCPQDQGSVEIKPRANPQGGAFVPLAATVKAEPVDSESKKGESIERAIDHLVESAHQPEPDAGIVLKNETDSISETPIGVASDEAATEPAASSEDVMVRFRVSAPFAKGLVAICNFVILTAVILYCLSLLMCLKISLAGRLGGINHITRAFFISLFLLVIITPWQVILPKVLIGTVWLPGELLCGAWDKADSSVFWKVMLYLRFCGLWFVAVWLLLWTQIRSGKWTRATLRRLGVLR